MKYRIKYMGDYYIIQRKGKFFSFWKNIQFLNFTSEACLYINKLMAEDK
jgi:hypothetical protein